jgi:NADH:ubiquinone reductase (non-electrogenic)
VFYFCFSDGGRTSFDDMERREHFEKYQVWVTAINFEGKTIECRGAIGSQRSNQLEGEGVFGENGDNGGEEFEVQYDKFILFPGAGTSMFSTPGVKENCLFLKTVKDASTFREVILDCFEAASLPTLAVLQKREIIHFAIIGGGPTGVELAAEVDELIFGH